MILLPFEGPRLKVAHATAHFLTLQKTLEAYTSRVRIDFRPLGGKPPRWRVAFSESCPKDVPLQIGDTVHNLRSSLDLLLCDIARKRGKSEKEIKYPFAMSAADLQTSRSFKMANRLGPDVVAAILATAPYHGGNALLRGIHDLDIIDKHQLILPILSFLSIQPDPTAQTALVSDMLREDLIQRGIEPPESFDFVIADDDIRVALVEGEEVIGPPDGDHPSRYYPTASGSIWLSFPKESPFAGQPVLATLEDALQLGDEIVESFSRKFG